MHPQYKYDRRTDWLVKGDERSLREHTNLATFYLLNETTGRYAEARNLAHTHFFMPAGVWDDQYLAISRINGGRLLYKRSYGLSTGYLDTLETITEGKEH